MPAIVNRLRRVAIVASIASLTAAGSALAQPQNGIVRPTTEPSTPSRQLGAQLYAGNCASCHGIGGSGIKVPRPGAGNIMGAGPPLRNVGALAPDFYLRNGYMPLGNYTEQPGPEKQRVLFSDKEIRSLDSYVASLGSGAAIPDPHPAAGSLSTGQAQFLTHCAGCHQIEGRGGYVTGAEVPPLQNVPATRIAEAVRIGPYLMPRFSTKQISDAQLNSIVRYVLSTNHPDNRGGWSIGNLGPIPEGLVAWWIAGPLLIIACRMVGRRRKRT
ncbi:MAG: c-type cytochrome [Solirubrobacteraceae bacterium]